jgi:hypothetical protein
LARAEAITLIAFVTPGPAVSAATCGRRVSFARALGGETGGLLVTDVDQAQVLVARPVVQREEVPAGEGEEVPDAGVPQHLDGQVATDELRLLRRFSHALSIRVNVSPRRGCATSTSRPDGLLRRQELYRSVIRRYPRRMTSQATVDLALARRRFTVEEYERMGRAGILDEADRVAVSAVDPVVGQ